MSHIDELWIVIPTASRLQYLDDIFIKSHIPPDRRVLIRTDSGDQYPDCINLWVLDVFNIQKWWNSGLDYVRDQGGRYVAVLNDDVLLQDGQLEKLLTVLIEEDSVLALPVNHGDAGWGHCWIVDLDKNVRPDERFTWWCGDHDLEIQAQRKGRVSYFPLPIENLHANELTSSSPALLLLAKKDIWTFRRKYPVYFLREIFQILKKWILK
jgi:hypothetical protein